jgi:hypothetical protein
MNVAQRKVAIIASLGKKYSGMVDIPNPNFRTTDLLNSASTFWRNPNEKCYDNAILMHNVILYADDSAAYRKFEKLQIKLSDIIYFYDDIENVGDELEKKRASRMVGQAREKAQLVNIITKEIAYSFYHITGTFYGLFRKKSKDKFIALTQARIAEILKKQDKWVKRSIPLPRGFIGISNDYIEAITIG